MTNYPHCSDFADQYPNATVVGTDISPIQPTWVPPNVQLSVLYPAHLSSPTGNQLT